MTLDTAKSNKQVRVEFEPIYNNKLDSSSQVQWTEYFEIKNSSQFFDIIIAEAQGYDENGVNDGLSSTTGVVVIGRDIQPNDIARVILSSIKCRSTRAECTLTWKNRESGEEGTLKLDDFNADPEKYLIGCRWALGDK